MSPDPQRSHVETWPAEAWSSELLDHGEGPVWDPADGVLRCVDMLEGDIVTFDSTAVATRQKVGAVAAAWRPRVGGGLVVAQERGFALIDPDGAWRDLGELWSDPDIRMNDGGCDPHGRFYCGSMAYDARAGAGSLWMLDTDGHSRQVLTGLTISNGLAWSPDGERAYYVDSATGGIDVLAFSADGSVTTREPWVQVDPADGTPDGLTVDAEGGVWVALWDGAQVHRYDTHGVLDHLVRVPVSRPTACTFGGQSLEVLYITSSRLGVDPTSSEAHRAGAVFAVEPAVRGLAAAAFAG